MNHLIKTEHKMSNSVKQNAVMMYGKSFCLMDINKMLYSGADPETFAASQMELFMTIVNDWKPLCIATKYSTVNVAGFISYIYSNL